MGCRGWVFDPETGERVSVSVEAQGGSLILREGGAAARSINPQCLYPVERLRGAEVYALKGVRGFRLGLVDVDDELVEARLPEFSLRESGNFHPAFLVFTAMSMLAVMGMILVAP
ncbi:hypothetical protein B5C34_04565 [Pacificimonas flava]|uniref:Uncharacterized protein n=2 Tax=Pacificimonas TaxID=1960290 RepID=A0A219B3U5_9SPHN|nr:hypothetical protein B5C34_04565 [Pacificimonas flava]